MMIMIISILVGAVLGTCGFVVARYFSYKSHITKRDHMYGKVDFQDFVSYLDRYEQKVNTYDDKNERKYMMKYSEYEGITVDKIRISRYPSLNAWFDDSYTVTRICPDVIKFEDKYMLLDFWSYIRFAVWYYKTIHGIKKDDLNRRRNDGMFNEV